MNKYIFLFSLSGICLSSGNATNHTNFIIINLDDAGFGDFSYNGATGYTTPHIDRLAVGGMQMTHFLAAQPVSGASRAGLLTGCYPNRIGFKYAPSPGSDYGIHPDEMTLAELLKQKNYSTAIFGKWHLGDYREFMPLQNGFDEYYGLPYSNDMWPYHPQQGEIFNFPDLPLYEGNDIIGYNTDQTQFTTDYTKRTTNFIRKNQENPFFIYLAHSMPHVPLAVSDKFKGKSDIGIYGDVMMELDWSVGEIVNVLQELELEENTLLILTSDNGPWLNYGNHAGSAGGLREGKLNTFEGGNRVPCIMYWKNTITPGTVCNKLASNIDLFPTLAELSCAPLPEKKIDGVSLVPLIQGDINANPRESFAYYFEVNDLQAVTDGFYKLVFPHHYNSYEGFEPGNDGLPGKMNSGEIKQNELYDLRRDPGERYNVINLYPGIAAKLEKMAEEMREELGDNLTGAEGNNRRRPGYVKDYKSF